MLGTNSFKIFNENNLNLEDDTTYASDAQRLNGVAPGIASVVLHNKLYRQLSVMVAALGQFIANAGYTANDADLNALISAITGTFASAITLDNYRSGITPCTDSGSANTYVLTPVAPGKAPIAYSTNQVFWFKATNANTGASTANIAGLGVKNIYKNVNTALTANDILQNQIVWLIYDGTNLQLLTPNLLSAIAAKLDATAYTAADVLAKIKTVDGSGSGIDADTLRTYTPGNATNQIPLSNGTKNVNLNAEKINGLTASATPGTTNKSDIVGMINEVNSGLGNHTGNSSIHVTSTDKTNWNGKTAPADVKALIEQTSFETAKLNKDTNGVWVEIDKKRKTDGTLAIKSVLSGGTSPQYTTRTVTYYGTDGTTEIKTETFTISYDTDGDVSSEV